jgi:hypothetical protein
MADRAQRDLDAEKTLTLPFLLPRSQNLALDLDHSTLDKILSQDVESQMGQPMHFVSMSIPACLAYHVLSFVLGILTTVGMIWGLSSYGCFVGGGGGSGGERYFVVGP